MGADGEMIAAAPKDVDVSLDVDVGAGVRPDAIERPARPRAAWFALRGRLPASRYRLLAVAGFAALFGVWAWASHRESMNPVFV
ncbi:MAG: hypothetical protein ABUS79_12450, partial [Pseudomonadota bacterium]